MGDEKLVSVGDPIHHPMQLGVADIGPTVSVSSRGSADARRRVLRSAADHGALLMAVWCATQRSHDAGRVTMFPTTRVSVWEACDPGRVEESRHREVPGWVTVEE